ncbi:MAG: ornithine carbamoyltransferase [Anaerolineales bacterium]
MRHFLSLTDYSPAEIQENLNQAIRLKDEWRRGGNEPVLKGKVLAMVFQKPSLRTRVSFDMAMRQLGGDALYLSPSEIGLGKREAIADVSRVLSGYVDAIMARVFAHAHIVELARFASVPVINGLSDFNHPCQAMADMLTVMERFGQVNGLHFSYIGDGNNVAVSLLFACSRLGAHFTIASPPGYELPSQAVAVAQEMADDSGATIRQLNNPAEAAKGAHILYTDTWVSMGQEDEEDKRADVFRPYQVNQKLVNLADPSSIVMHCLPAHRGQEITDEVADGPHSVIFQQAENRMHAQKSILVTLLTGD